MMRQRQRKHRLTAGLIAFFMTFSLMGCTSKADMQADTMTLHDASDVGVIATRHFTDGVGREVIVPEHIQSVAALYTVVGHAMIMLDRGDLITSCSKGLKRDKLILNMVPEMNDIAMPKDGGEINLEELLKTAPDIIFIDISTYWDKAQLEIIEKLGIPYYVVAFNSIDSEIKLIQDLSVMLDNEAEGQAYIDFYKNAVATADAIVSQIPEAERLRVYHAVNEAVRTSPSGTLPAEWLEKAGCINVALSGSFKQDEDKYYTTLEDILLWNPQVILVNEPETYDYILDMKAWSNIDAVENHRVYLLPTGVSRWGHATSLETPLAILWTLKQLYPQYAEEVDIQSITKQFYHDLFEYELTDAEVTQILSGLDMRKTKNLE